MVEWCVRVTSPVRVLDTGNVPVDHARHRRDLYVWTTQHSAVDAYAEALRVLQGWPQGTVLVELTPVGMYIPQRGLIEPAG